MEAEASSTLCPTCLRKLCFCGVIGHRAENASQIPLHNTIVHVIQHVTERRKRGSTSSVPVMRVALRSEGYREYVWSNKAKNDGEQAKTEEDPGAYVTLSSAQVTAELLSSAGCTRDNTLLLYPGPDSVPLEEAVAALRSAGTRSHGEIGGTPELENPETGDHAGHTSAAKHEGLSREVNLLVLDGTWKEAKQLYNQIGFAHYSKVHVNSLDAKKSLFDEAGVRHEPKEGFLSTLEAVALCLPVTEGGSAPVGRRAAEACPGHLLTEAFRRVLELQRACADRHTEQRLEREHEVCGGVRDQNRSESMQARLLDKRRGEGKRGLKHLDCRDAHADDSRGGTTEKGPRQHETFRGRGRFQRYVLVRDKRDPLTDVTSFAAAADIGTLLVRFAMPRELREARGRLSPSPSQTGETHSEAVDLHELLPLTLGCYGGLGLPAEFVSCELLGLPEATQCATGTTRAGDDAACCECGAAEGIKRWLADRGASRLSAMQVDEAAEFLAHLEGAFTFSQFESESLQLAEGEMVSDDASAADVASTVRKVAKQWLSKLTLPACPFPNCTCTASTAPPNQLTEAQHWEVARAWNQYGCDSPVKHGCYSDVKLWAHHLNRHLNAAWLEQQVAALGAGGDYRAKRPKKRVQITVQPEWKVFGSALGGC